MPLIAAIHSFRRGTGKSNTIANVAALLAEAGQRVGVIDTNLRAPGIEVLFGLPENRMTPSLNDFLWGKCEITEAVHDVTDGLGAPVTGKVFLVPASMKMSEITRIAKEPADANILHEGVQKLLGALHLDTLLIDTYPGLSEETLLTIATADVLAVVLRLDHQDYQGTAVVLEVAHQLAVPRRLLIVNDPASSYNLAAVKAQVERSYQCDVAAVLPHSDALMALASTGIFTLSHPDDPLTQALQRVATQLSI